MALCCIVVVVVECGQAVPRLHTTNIENRSQQSRFSLLVGKHILDFAYLVWNRSYIPIIVSDKRNRSGTMQRKTLSNSFTKYIFSILFSLLHPFFSLFRSYKHSNTNDSHTASSLSDWFNFCLNITIFADFYSNSVLSSRHSDILEMFVLIEMWLLLCVFFFFYFPARLWCELQYYDRLAENTNECYNNHLLKKKKKKRCCRDILKQTVYLFIY